MSGFILGAKRGTELPWAKLDESDVKLIRECAKERERLREKARQLSNSALSEKFGVHVKTIEKVLSYEIWRHITDK